MNTYQTSITAGAGLTIALGIAALALAQNAAAPQPNGESVFNARCKMCHDPAVERAPSRAELAFRSRRSPGAM